MCRCQYVVFIDKQSDSYRNAEDVEIIGAVVYTGTDIGAKRLSTVFVGSDIIQELVEKYEPHVRKLLDKLATGIK
jgi:hypothetical protein